MRKAEQMGFCLSAFLMLFLLIGYARTANILMIPGNHGGHVILFAATGETLRAAGHNVYMLTFLRFKDQADRSGLKTLLWDKHSPGEPLENYDMFESMLLASEFRAVTMLYSNITNAHIQAVNAAIGVVEDLKSLDLDLAMVDGSPFSRSYYIVPYQLNIKYITLNAVHAPWDVGLPSLPSIEPVHMLLVPSDDPSFMHRLLSLFCYFLHHTVPKLVSPPDDIITDYIPDAQIRSFDDLYQKSELWFINIENICLGYPRISAPHYHYVAGTGVAPVKPLPPALEEFIHSSEDHGIIVVTFGSMIKRIPPQILQKVFNALGRVKQKVLMRHDDGHIKLPSNIRVQSWLPQNDLLGHPKTKLFITHGGNNGQIEALYHGVPMVTMPFYGDQRFNSKRAEARGYGKMVDPRNFEAGDLYDAVTEVINNTIYRDNIQRCSKIYRHMPHPGDIITFWTNHVLEFGGDHLKPRYMNMPLWKVFMVDINIFLMAVVIFVVWSSYWCMMFCRRRCLGDRSKTKSD